mmetsp:Transcript_62571/g.171827  ORF Transcript_62571/g.171827 Transcript_62571/m.171827 type:complete len:147 (+) Transcript_62571:87-527(+)
MAGRARVGNVWATPLGRTRATDLKYEDAQSQNDHLGQTWFEPNRVFPEFCFVGHEARGKAYSDIAEPSYEPVDSGAACFTLAVTLHPTLSGELQRALLFLVRQRGTDRQARTLLPPHQPAFEALLSRGKCLGVKARAKPQLVRSAS